MRHTLLQHKEVEKLTQYHLVSKKQRKKLHVGILALKSLLRATTLYCFLTDDMKSLLDTAEKRISELEDKYKEFYNIKVTIRRNAKKSLRRNITKGY